MIRLVWHTILLVFLLVAWFILAILAPVVADNHAPSYYREPAPAKSVARWYI